MIRYNLLYVLIIIGMNNSLLLAMEKTSSPQLMSARRVAIQLSSANSHHESFEDNDSLGSEDMRKMLANTIYLRRKLAALALGSPNQGGTSSLTGQESPIATRSHSSSMSVQDLTPLGSPTMHYPDPVLVISVGTDRKLDNGLIEKKARLFPAFQFSSKSDDIVEDLGTICYQINPDKKTYIITSVEIKDDNEIVRKEFQEKLIHFVKKSAQDNDYQVVIQHI